MNVYLSDDTIEKIFAIIFTSLFDEDSSISGIFANILRNNIEICYTDLNNEYLEIEYDELGLIDLEKTLNNIKGYYCNSFLEDNHIELLIFLSDVIHDLGGNVMFANFLNAIDNEIRPFNLCVTNTNSCAFIGEVLETYEEDIIVLNVLRMHKSFSDINRIEMVQERLKDAIFLLKNNRYTACLALVAFALEGFLRGIFSDSYDESEEQYKGINARVGKTSDNSCLTLNYTERIKPSTDLSTYTIDPSNRIDLHIRKIREKSNKSIIEVNIKNEYAGLICVTDKEMVTRTKKYNLEKLIEKAKNDNLIDNRIFLFESFDFLRKVRNNIVHFDEEHREVTQLLKAKKILFKIIEFINTKLYVS